MNRFTVLISLVLCVIGGSFSAHQPPALPQKGSGPGKPLSPQDAQKLFKIDDGLRIELVACEPQIESPVAMQFAPDGRLWVVEMRDYPNGPGKGEKPAGRIRILEDKDGDGFFETSTIWADNLLFANGLLLWKDGAIVTMAPKITHLRDTQGTGKADKEDILYVGFAEQNPQLRVSHPILGLDGWIYCANGLRGGKVVSASGGRQPPDGAKNQGADAPRSPVDLSGMDFRFDPITTAYEAITGPGQYGNTFDEWGNRFICDNRHHLRHVVMENRYIKRNPYLAAPALVEDVSVLDDGPLSSGGKVYPLSKNWTTSSLHEGRFTAACGVFIYHGKLLDTSPERKRREDKPVASAPGWYQSAAFTCEPTGNLVHMEILTPKGATFSAKPHKQGVEFLATTDDWFRPVFLTHGPEGAMYVVDMYRAVIEHPDFMPPELKNRPDLWQGKDKGRIWRIVPKDHKTKTPRPGLATASIAELVKTLEHEEPWYRQTAQRLLLEKNDKAMIEPLTKRLETTKSPHAKILTAWMLERQGKLSRNQIEFILRDKDPRVREQGIRIAESTADKTGILVAPVNAKGLANDEDARVRFQLALSVGGLDENEAGEIAAVVAWHGYNDRWTRMAAQSSLPKHMPKIFEIAWFKAIDIPGRQVSIRELATLLAAQSDADIYRKTFQTVAQFQEEWKWAGLTGLAEGLERKRSNLVSVELNLLAADRKQYANEIAVVIAQAEKAVRDTKKPIDQRLMALKISSHAPWPTAKQALVPLITEDASPELRIAALRALAAQQDKEVPALLMKLWPSAAPSMRREILEAMLRQPARISVLLDEIEAKRVKSSELDPARTRQLVNHKDTTIRTRAAKLLATVPSDRQKVLAEYQAALTLKGDAKNGREVFKKNCATCHRVAGLGVDVGPDIADTRTKKLDALLFDILVPNAAIDANYVNYVVTTKDGGLFTGMLAVETASSITLKRAEAQTDVILRKDLDELQSTGISLMPDEFERTINVQQMADLLRFLKDWRYLDGSVPTTP